MPTKSYKATQNIKYLISQFFNGQGFLLTIVDYGVYTNSGYLTFLRPIPKSFLAFKDFSKHILHAKFQTNWAETEENRSDSKLISDRPYDCVHNASKNG